jgi:hypothetical protein
LLHLLDFSRGGSFFEKEGEGQEQPKKIPQPKKRPINACTIISSARRHYVWIALCTC